MSKKIGERIHFDQAKFSQAYATLETQLVPVLEEVIKKYVELGIGPFEKDAMSQVLNNSLGKIQKQYEEAVKDQSTKLGAAIAGAVVDPSRISSLFNHFAATVEKLHTRFHAATAVPFNRPDISLTDMILKSGKISIDKEALEKRFSIYVETEDQLRFLELLANLKGSYDKVREFMNEAGMPEYMIITSHSGYESLCWENEDGTLFVDPGNINLIKPL